ncbi:MAG: MFS transporter [Rhizobiaceae bacterium]
MSELSGISTDTTGEGATCPPQARKFVLVSAILASSMGFIDTSVVSLALPAIRSDLDATLVDAQWITNAYMLFLASLVLVGGAAGDVFGVRKVFATGVAVFVVTSALCALAWDENSLIVMRGAQGIGAALMVPGSLSIIAKAYPRETRGQAIGTWAAFSSITTALGPIIGSLILSYGEDWMWRLIFAINVPFGLGVLAMLFLKVPADRGDSGRRLDFGGGLLATLALGSFSWGLTAYGPEAASDVLPPAYWLALGAALSILFLWWEKRARQPMIKLELFRSPAFAGANVYTLVLFLAFNAILFFLPMTLVTAWDALEWQASLMLAPLSVFIGAMSRASGKFSDRFGPRVPLTAGALMLALSYLALALTMPLMNMWFVTLPIMCVNAFGMGLLVSPLSSSIMKAAPENDTGLASGVNNAVARSAGLVSIAAFGALAGTVFSGSIDPVVTGDLEGVGFGAFIPADATDALKMAHADATNWAFQVVAIFCAAISLLAAAIGWVSQPGMRQSSR